MSKFATSPDAPPTHVVAAVLEDLRGRILLTRRTANRDFAGLWEFPGGKREPGETALEALARELHEELGITIGPATPVIAVRCATPARPRHQPQPTPHPANGSSSPPLAQQGEAGRGSSPPRKRLLLDVHHVTQWTGRPHGREGQATLWVPKDRLHRYAMPPADRPVAAALTLPPLMLVTPEPDPDALDAFVDAVLEATHRALQRLAQPVHPSIPQDERAGHAPRAPAALADPAPRARTALADPAPGPLAVRPALPDGEHSGSGPRALAVRPEVSKGEPPYGAHTLLVQLRTKTLPAAARHSLAATLLRHLPSAATLAINSDTQAARTLRTGLHLTAAQLATTTARPIARERLLGASCHSAEDLARADALGCNYAVLGPVHPTATHPGAPALGWPAFAALREASSLPIYAIGGLTPDDLATARAHGAQGIAAIRAFWPGHIVALQP